MTEGKLNASFSGIPHQQEFNTTDVKFLGSDDDQDFYLEGEEGQERSISFYFPKADIENGFYALAPDGDISAFYVVRGSLTWETLEGSIEVSPDMNNELVTIKYKFSAKEGGSGSGVIKVSGSGRFEGRTPWTQAARRLLKQHQQAKA
jgi:hypothetical protein